MWSWAWVSFCQLLINYWKGWARPFYLRSCLVKVADLIDQRREAELENVMVTASVPGFRAEKPKAEGETI
eukprot:5150258-Amphidinium_carterae.1